MGNHGSLPSEGAFESPLTSSPVADEKNSSQLDSNVSTLFSSNVSTPTSKHQSATKPIPTPAHNNYYPDSESKTSNSSSFLGKVETNLLEESLLLDSTESISILESSFDSSHSSIINISERSSESTAGDDEQSSSFSEVLLHASVDRVKGMLESVTFEPENPIAISDQTLNSLNALYQAIGEFVSNYNTSQCVSATDGSDIKQLLPDFTISSSTLTCAKEDEFSVSDKRKGNKSLLNQTFHLDSIPLESVDELNDTFYACSKCGRVVKEEEKIASLVDAAASRDNALADSNVKTISDHIQIAHDNGSLTIEDTDYKCMLVEEKLVVEPLLHKSLAALQPKTGESLVLIDGQVFTCGTCLPPNIASQQLLPDLNKESMCFPKQKIYSTALKRIPENVSKDTLAMMRHPIGLKDIINDDKSAATLGKAVIRNALVFEKYALLFKRALNDDIVTASIGKALCRNALLFETDQAADVNDKESQLQEQQQVLDTALDKPSGNIQEQVFNLNQIPYGDKNKENENPTVEHLFKQTASKRKLGTLEEETRRTKCLVLSQKSTTVVDKQTSSNTLNAGHLIKPIRKAKHVFNVNDSQSNTSISTIVKTKKKEMLQEIIMNSSRNEVEKQQEWLLKKEDKDGTLIHTGMKKEKWTVVEKNIEDTCELEDTDDESKTQSETEDIIECDQTDVLVGNKFDSRSQQLDSLSGIYYFTNKYIFCGICNANIFNHLRILDHINGKVHKTNMMKHKKTVASFISTKAMLQSVWDQIDVSLGRKLFCKLVKFENDMLTCTLCNVQVSGCLNVIAHVLGKEHKATSVEIIYSTSSVSKELDPAEANCCKISWSDGSTSSSDVSLAECEGSIAEWLPPSTPTRSTAVESDLFGIYYFAKNYVFCSICNINMFNSSIVLGHAHAKSHLANTLLQKQIESKEMGSSVLGNEKKMQKIWNQIERTLGGTLFCTVLCVDKKDNFFCDLCNMQVIIPGHLNILYHVLGKKHNQAFLKHVQQTHCK